MKFLITAFLFLSSSAFACPGSTAITIDTPLTQISGDKVTGIIYATNKTTQKTSKINLNSYEAGKTFSFPAKDESILFFIIDKSVNTNRTIYYVFYNGKAELMDPNMVARDINDCGFNFSIP
jgi:hypothetical protein